MNQNTDNTTSIIIALMLIPIVFGMVIWWNFHTTLSMVGIKAALFTLEFIEWCLSKGTLGEVITFAISPWNEWDLEKVKQTIHSLHRADPRFMSASQLYDNLDLGGALIRLLITPLVLYAMFWIFKSQSPSRMRKFYNLQELAVEMTQYHKHLKPVLYENLLEKSPDEGSTAREVSPIRFAIFNGLITVHKRNYLRGLTNTMLIPTFDKSKKSNRHYIVLKDDLEKSISKIHGQCKLDEKATLEVFTKQLGSPYTHWSNFNLARKAMYAVCCRYAQAKKHKDIAMSLLEKMNDQFCHERILEEQYFTPELIAELEATIKEFEKSEVVQNVHKVHHYELTLLPGMLEAARTKGKLWTSLFWWVKKVDRPLWYALHQEGGQTSWTEAAGPRAHKLAEQMMQHSIETPYVDTAVVALKEYLDDNEGWIPTQKELEGIEK